MSSHNGNSILSRIYILIQGISVCNYELIELLFSLMKLQETEFIRILMFVGHKPIIVPQTLSVSVTTKLENIIEVFLFCLVF